MKTEIKISSNRICNKITGRDALPECTSTSPSVEFKKYDTKDYKEQALSQRSV